MIATVILCAVIAGFVVLAVRSFRKTLRSGCCGAGDIQPIKIHVKDSELSHYPYEKILEIDGMTCRNCAAHVQNSLNSIDGVYSKVDLIKKEAAVHMKDKLPESLLRKAVSDAGYAVTAIHEGAKA